MVTPGQHLGRSAQRDHERRIVVRDDDTEISAHAQRAVALVGLFDRVGRVDRLVDGRYADAELLQLRGSFAGEPRPAHVPRGAAAAKGASRAATIWEGVGGAGVMCSGSVEGSGTHVGHRASLSRTTHVLVVGPSAHPP